MFKLYRSKLTLLLSISSLMMLSLPVYTQTGPGGIGNSTSNGLWLDASTIQAANGSNVSSWGDHSGNANDADQPTASRQPIYYSTSSLNNQPIVRLDGSDDQLVVADNNILDGTSGITFYAVIRPNNLNGSARGIFGKRISYTDPTNYAYSCFFYSGNYLNLDIHTNNNRFSSSPTSFSNGTNYLLRMQFDASLAPTVRSKIHSNGVMVKQSTEASTSIPNSNQNLAIGALNEDYGTYLGADYAELIHFNYALDSVEDLIVQNYLSAKYGISIGPKDLYAQDSPGNGDYDFQVAGLGKIDATQIHDDSQGDGILRIHNPTDLDLDEYFFFGHNNDVMGTFGNTDIPTGMEGRWFREWRVSEVNATKSSVDVGSIDLDFDLTGMTYASASDIGLIVDTDNDGIFADETPITGAIDLGGNVIRFSGVSAIGDNMRFTLGTFDLNGSPLPVELLSFEAIGHEKQVDIYWSTASELNADHFEIERSNDGDEWESIESIQAAGNSTSQIDYYTFDNDPYIGKSFYRLVQYDNNGDSKVYNPIPVYISEGNEGAGVSLFPNPASQGDINLNFRDLAGKEVLVVLRDITGKEYFSKLIIVESNDQITAIDPQKHLAAGTYLVTASSENIIYSEKLVIK